MIWGRMNNKELGLRGEEIAAEWLLGHGFSLLERNWRYRGAEIDIIAVRDDTLRIIEVKSRSERSRDSITNSLSDVKLRQLVKGADGYVSSRGCDFTGGVRFDLVTVIFSGGTGYEVEYTPSFFYPEWTAVR